MKVESMTIGVTSATRKNSLMWLFTRLCMRGQGVKVINLYPEGEEDYKQCDGYVFSGGEDIDPKFYNQENRYSIKTNERRDNYELGIARHAIDQHKPILGICRGAQLINVAKEGTLYQNAGEFFEDFVPTRNLLGKIFLRRKITLEEKSVLFDIFKKTNIWVNSIHHQAVDKLGGGLRVIARDEYGMVQAYQSEDNAGLSILGVQWHPEFMFYSRRQRKLFSWLVDMCRERHSVSLN